MDETIFNQTMNKMINYSEIEFLKYDTIIKNDFL